MAKKRDLKQTINYICNELLAEAVAACIYSTSDNSEALEGILSTIILTKSDYVRRVSHPEPGMAPKQYYQQIINDFDHQVSEIIDQIASLG